MRIASILEDRNFENRIAITPEIAKKYIALGFEVSLTENYGEHLGFRDQEYKELGVKISKDEKEIINSADVILLGVSRTSKTPTSIYLANRGYKTVNVPLVLDQKIPNGLAANSKSCIVGLVADPERLADIRRNRVAIMKDHNLKEYTDLDVIKNEVESSKKLFKKNNWPVIDVTRKSVEETAASILKIIEIKKNR